MLDVDNIGWFMEYDGALGLYAYNIRYVLHGFYHKKQNSTLLILIHSLKQNESMN